MTNLPNLPNLPDLPDLPEPQRNCPQGHHVPDPLQECPVCGETVVEIEDQQAPGRSLWDLMGQDHSPTQTDSDLPDPPDPLDPARPTDDEETADEAIDSDKETAEEVERPKGLWSVMQRDDAGPVDEAESPPSGLAELPGMPEVEPIELDEATETDIPEEEDEDESDAKPVEPDRASSKSCGISLAAGIIATLLAGLGLVPPVIWTSLPALLAGLIAVYTGLVGIGETGSKGLSGRGKASVGIALGTLGMFLPRMLQMLL